MHYPRIIYLIRNTDNWTTCRFSWCNSVVFIKIWKWFETNKGYSDSLLVETYAINWFQTSNNAQIWHSQLVIKYTNEEENNEGPFGRDRNKKIHWFGYNHFKLLESDLLYDPHWRCTISHLSCFLIILFFLKNNIISSIQRSQHRHACYVPSILAEYVIEVWIEVYI